MFFKGARHALIACYLICYHFTPINGTAPEGTTLFDDIDLDSVLDDTSADTIFNDIVGTHHNPNGDPIWEVINVAEPMEIDDPLVVLDTNYAFPLPLDEEYVPDTLFNPFGPTVDPPELISLIAQDLFEAAFDSHGASTGFLPENPANDPENYDVSCIYGRSPYVPEQIEFPLDWAQPYFKSDYPTLYDLCSYFTQNPARHLAFTCRNPGLGDWPYSHSPPRADVGLSRKPKLIELCYESCRCRVKKPNRLLPKEGQVLVKSPQYTLVWKHGGVHIEGVAGVTFLPRVESFSGSGTGSGGTVYTICRLSAGSDGRCKSYKSPVACKGSCPNTNLPPAVNGNQPKSPIKPPGTSIPISIPEIAHDQSQVCHTKCDVSNHFRCGNRREKCRCLASRVTGSLANLAGCASLLTIKGLMAKQNVAGSRLGGRGVDPLAGVQFGCVCNGTYASAACCDAEDGLVYEQHHLGLGQLEL